MIIFKKNYKAPQIEENYTLISLNMDIEMV